MQNVKCGLNIINQLKKRIYIINKFKQYKSKPK